jgi:hypothetical protein
MKKKWSVVSIDFLFVVNQRGVTVLGFFTQLNKIVFGFLSNFMKKSAEKVGFGNCCIVVGG